MNKSLWQKYWESLGGWVTLLQDKYFYIALILTALLLPLWWHPFWWDTILSVISILVGFSISGFAVILSISDARFKARLLVRSSYDRRSPFLMANAAFTHYITSGFLALLAALICKAWYQPTWLPSPEADLQDFNILFTVLSKFLWTFSGFLFCYCLSSGVGAIFYIYHIAEITQTVSDHEKTLAELEEKANEP